MTSGDSPGSLPRRSVDLLVGLGVDGYQALMAQLDGCGCVHPVRLSGMTMAHDPDSGETEVVCTSADQPTGFLAVRCGTRRESLCPTCSALYARDARRIIVEGLEDGHPAVFATMTAPSFGAVHRTVDGR